MVGVYTRAAVAKRRKDRAERLQAELNRVRDILAPRPDIIRIIVFGSFARGNNTERSDLDVVVVQKTENKFLERLDELYRLILPKIDLDLLVYTPEEWNDLLESRSFVQSIEKEGKIIYEKSS